MVKRIRNKNCIPYLSAEGVITKPIPPGITKKGASWHVGLSPFERVYSHQTLNSVRRYANFKPFSHQVPSDSLDFILESTYDHSKEIFPEKTDCYLQPDTIGATTWRRLRNTRDLPPVRDLKGPDFCFYDLIEGGLQIKRYNRFHAVLIGGIKAREHPAHVKLMNSSHHSPQTNAGYSRQESDGSFFKY
ncbi:hypothetical protein FQR65_LT14273 [Abscondita terminalis]|nr:hypothetical protein FQR65_LT14273 [Abscondita terminalis]